MFGTSIADLDHRRLVDYFVRVRDQDVFETAKADGADANRTMRVSQPERNHSYEVAWQSLLLNAGILQRRFGAQSGESPAATVASLMLFGKDPSRHLPQAGIEATAYAGKTKDGNVRKRDALHGPIVPLQGEDGAVQEPGLVGRTMKFIRRFASTECLGTDGRQGALDYAPEAVCEAIFNAIAHRDYLSASSIEVDVYADRLEVVSPGPLRWSCFLRQFEGVIKVYSVRLSMPSMSVSPVAAVSSTTALAAASSVFHGLSTGAISLRAKSAGGKAVENAAPGHAAFASGAGRYASAGVRPSSDECGRTPL